MGKDDGEEQQGTPPAGSRRRRQTTEPTAAAESSAGTGGSSASSSPLDVDPGSFTPPKEPPPPRTADELAGEAEYEPPPPELIEWTPERAAAIVRGVGFGFHVLDPVGHTMEGEELWRWTRDDALEAGEPLSRILNRYAPARRLAGYSDEAELAIIMGSYVRRNLADRGRLLALQAELAKSQQPETWARDQPPQPPPRTDYEGPPWAGGFAEPPPEEV